MKNGMEIGRVKFFDTREGKMFGFLVDDAGDELFFHYSGGYQANLFLRGTSLSYPRKGDYLMFERGRNSKGPKATIWCFKRDYDRAIEKLKCDLTLDEAEKRLSSATADVLEYTAILPSIGISTAILPSIGISTVKTISITWSNDSERLAVGEFVQTFWRCEGADESENDLREATATVKVYSPDRRKYHDTEFKGTDADALKELGRRQVRKGIRKTVLWNGGWDDFVVDPGNVREATADELTSTDQSPWLGTHDWLKCSFAAQFGGRNQVVRIIAHLGGGD